MLKDMKTVGVLFLRYQQEQRMQFPSGARLA